MKKHFLTFLSAAFLSATAFSQQKGLIISEFLANPENTDSPYEYVELVATANINFSSTPYTVVFCNNGNATSSGWRASSTKTYAFQINTGSVTAGQVVYVGGSSMEPISNGGIVLRKINTGTTNGDSFGTKSSSGVLGDGGDNADGIAVFSSSASSISSSTVPVDAIFFGDGIGSAIAGTNQGYQMPVNDRYNGGKLVPTSFLAPDPASGELVRATGVFNAATQTFTTVRSWATTSSATYNQSSVTLGGGSSNISPSVFLAAPLVSGTAPATVSLSATATDTDGSVSKVEFFNGASLLATLTVSPYTFSWTNVSAGTYSVTAKATDNLGAAAVSAVQNVIVTPASGNISPSVTLATPTVSGNAPATVGLSATASDADGSVAKVEFFNGSTLLSTATVSPYTFSWTNVTAGTYNITAKATDDLGAVITSSPKTVTVSSAVNVAPTLSFNSSATYLVNESSGKISCVRNDATDPVIVSGLDITVTDNDLSTLTFQMTSSKTSVVPNVNFTVTGTGNARKFRINPTAVGFTAITLKVTDAAGLNKSISFSLAVSNAITTASVSDVYHSGIADGSTSIPVDADYMFIADDETNTISLYNRHLSGLPIYKFDVGPYLNLGGTEVDIEGSFRSPTIPNRIYWIGSLSNSKSGEARPDRNRLFATDIVGSGADATLRFVGYYSGLRSRLISWGDANGYNFTGKAATGIEPKRIDGFNVEGFEMGPDGTTAYIGFRAPYVGSVKDKAVICPFNNFEAWFNNGSPSGTPLFSAPIELNLGAKGIRSLGKNTSNEFLIVAGSYAATGTFALYSWNGQRTSAPILLSANLTGLSPEGIADVPASLSGFFQVQLISDIGSLVIYNDGLENKDASEPNNRKFMSSVINVNGSQARMSDETEISEEIPSSFIYPNPFSSVVTVETGMTEDKWDVFQILSLNGTLLKETEAVSVKGKVKLDLHMLEAGTYLLRIKGSKTAFRITKE